MSTKIRAFSSFSHYTIMNFIYSVSKQKHLFEESKWSFKSFCLVADGNKTCFLNACILLTYFAPIVWLLKHSCTALSRSSLSLLVLDRKLAARQPSK